MKTLLSIVGCTLVLSLVAAAEPAWTNRFGASFADYAVGETLSAKGGWGGFWAASADGQARCVEDGGRKGMSFATFETSGLRFALDRPAAADDTVKFEFSLCVEDFGLTTDVRPEAGAAAAVITVADSQNRPALAGWNGTGWVLLSADGATLVGTEDGMLALVDGSRVRSEGGTMSGGRIHALATAPDGKTVWGVTGHRMGVAYVFRWTRAGGLELIGLPPDVKADCGRNVHLYNATTVAVSPDGRFAAVGGTDALGGVTVFKIGDLPETERTKAR